MNDDSKDDEPFSLTAVDDVRAVEHGFPAKGGVMSICTELVERMVSALKAAERADNIHSKCEECMEYGQSAEVCEKCFPSADDARVMRRNVLAEIKKSNRARRNHD